MSRPIKFQIISLAALLLSACGGGNTGGDENSTFNSLQDARDEAEFLLDKLDGLDVTSAQNAPTSGTASYEGVFTVAREVPRFPGDTDPNLEDTLLGELRLNFDFQENTLAGDADNFFGTDGSVSGELTIADGEIIRDDTAAVFVAGVSGRLPIANAQRDIEGGLLGTFSGNQAQAATGLFFGDADEEIPLIGGIIADN